MRGMKYLWAALCLAATSGAALAQEAAFELPLVSSAYVRDHESFLLAASETQQTLVKKSGDAAPEVRHSDFEPPLFSGSNAHKYMGLSTIVLAGLTAAAAPGEGCETNCASAPPRETNGTHAKLAKATAVMAIATVATGLLAHWDDFHFEDGITDPDNMHVLLGVTGAALMAHAVKKSMDSSVQVSHAGEAIAGAALMVTAIKITW